MRGYDLIWCERGCGSTCPADRHASFASHLCARGAMHVVARCNNREFYFGAQEDFRILLDHLGEMSSAYGVRLFGYTLMSKYIPLIIYRDPGGEFIVAQAVGEWGYSQREVAETRGKIAMVFDRHPNHLLGLGIWDFVAHWRRWSCRGIEPCRRNGGTQGFAKNGRQTLVKAGNQEGDNEKAIIQRKKASREPRSIRPALDLRRNIKECGGKEYTY